MYDPIAIEAHAKRFTDLGFHIYLAHPESKIPWDVRPQSEKENAKGGVHASTNDLATVLEWLAKARSQGLKPNLGLKLTPQDRLVVIDADTPTARANLEKLAGWALDPYVLTPGTADGAHHGGAHFYFVVPDDFDKTQYPTFFTLIPAESSADQVDVKVYDSGVIMPPSYRNGDTYKYLDEKRPVPPLPVSLLSAIEQHGRDLRSDVEQAKKVMSDEDAEVFREWGRQIPWGDLLEADGWIPTGRVERCGCAEWCRPGNIQLKRSAVAHDEDCAAGFPPLLWCFSTTASAAVRHIIDTCNNGRTFATKFQLWRQIYFPFDYKEAFKSSGLAGRLTRRIYARPREDDAETKASTKPNQNCFEVLPNHNEESQAVQERSARLVSFSDDNSIRAFEDFALLERAPLESWIGFGQSPDVWNQSYEPLDPYTLWKLCDEHDLHPCLSQGEGEFRGFSTLVKRLSTLETSGAWVSERGFCAALGPVIGLKAAQRLFGEYVSQGLGPQVLSQLDSRVPVEVNPQ